MNTCMSRVHTFPSIPRQKLIGQRSNAVSTAHTTKTPRDNQIHTHSLLPPPSPRSFSSAALSHSRPLDLNSKLTSTAKVAEDLRVVDSEKIYSQDGVDCYHQKCHEHGCTHVRYRSSGENSRIRHMVAALSSSISSLHSIYGLRGVNGHKKHGDREMTIAGHTQTWSGCGYLQCTITGCLVMGHNCVSTFMRRKYLSSHKLKSPWYWDMRSYIHRHMKQTSNDNGDRCA